MKTRNYDELIALFRKWETFFESLPSEYYSFDQSGPLGSAFWEQYPHRLPMELKAFLEVFGEFTFNTSYMVVEIWIPFKGPAGRSVVDENCSGCVDMGSSWGFLDEEGLKDREFSSGAEGGEVSVENVLVFGTDVDLYPFGVVEMEDWVYFNDLWPSQPQGFIEWFSEKVNYSLGRGRKLPD
jgi:hypothetical protein